MLKNFLTAFDDNTIGTADAGSSIKKSEMEKTFSVSKTTKHRHPIEVVSQFLNTLAALCNNIYNTRKIS